MSILVPKTFIQNLIVVNVVIIIGVAFVQSRIHETERLHNNI